MKSAHGMKTAFWSVVKYTLAIALLVLVIRHAGVDKIFGYLKKIPPFQLVLGFALISCAQIASAMRMRFFFRSAGFHLNARFAIILFYVGAFYNFLLPGGIGGDAYKVVLTRRRMNLTAKQGIHIMLADRASGLCVIMFTMYAGLMALDFHDTIPYAKPLIIAAALVTFTGYLFFSRLLLKQRPGVMIGSLPYSVCTQGLWVAGVLIICGALSGSAYAVEYIVLYCTASITGMVPASPGGLGIKEYTYYKGAELLQHYAHSGVNPDLGIAISLCIFFLMLTASMPALLWVSKVEKAEFS